MDFIKRHPLALAVLGFMLINLPSGVAAWLILWEKIRSGNIGDVDWIGNITAINWTQMVPFLGIALFILVLWQIWKPQGSKLSEANQTDVISDLHDWIRSEIQHVHFGWLWTDDPYILFGISFSNSSPHDIEVTGVEGQANINSTPCTRDARVPTGFSVVHFPKFKPQYSLISF